MGRNQFFRNHPKCKRLGIIELCFADDLMIFSKANVQSIQLIKAEVEQFAEESGLQMNLAVSSIFVAGVNAEMKQVLMEIMGVNAGNLPVRYQGVPLAAQ